MGSLMRFHDWIVFARTEIEHQQEQQRTEAVQLWQIDLSLIQTIGMS